MRSKRISTDDKNRSPKDDLNKKVTLTLTEAIEHVCVDQKLFLAKLKSSLSADDIRVVQLDYKLDFNPFKRINPHEIQ
jgi:hypothetical protein